MGQEGIAFDADFGGAPEGEFDRLPAVERGIYHQNILSPDNNYREGLTMSVKF